MSAKELGFVTFSEFLEGTAYEDRQFFLESDLQENRVAPVICGMANGAGGWIVIGAEWDENEKRADVRGVSNPVALSERLVPAFSEQFSAPVSVSLCSLDDPVPLLLLHVWPVVWHKRPVCVDGDYIHETWRRIESVNVISSLNTRFRLGMDALERSRSDEPVRDLAIQDLHTESVAAFRETVIARHPEWAALSLENFLSRALVTSGESITRAGYFLLGRQAIRVRAELRGIDEAFEVSNLWRAWSDLLPRLTRSLSPSCAAAFRECFTNALIHAEHDAGRISIIVWGSTGAQSHGVRAHFENPGLARAWRPGESECRNFRLMKIFELLGAARGTGTGLEIIRRYAPDFRLEQNTLELSTVAVLHLEPDFGESTEPDAGASPELDAPVNPDSPLLVVNGTGNVVPVNEPGLEPEPDEPEASQAPEVPEPPARAKISFGDAAQDLENFVAAIKIKKDNGGNI